MTDVAGRAASATVAAMFVALRRRLAVGMAVLVAVPCALAASALPTHAATAGFTALPAPQRVLDTRPGGSTADHQHAGTGALAADQTYVLPLAGRVGLPGDLAAAVLNVTVTDPVAAGYVTVFPCGTKPPTASNLNYLPGQTVPNAVISALGNAAVCLYSKAPTHLIVDVSGWFTSGSYQPLGSPARLYDSRPARSTIDGKHAGEGIRPAESETRIRVAGRAGLGAAPASVVLNVTATETQGPGFATVYPCGVPRPNASNLNYQANATVPNMVVAKVGTNGDVCVFTKAGAHLVVDVAGALDASAYTPLGSPQRLLDTRPTGSTADGTFRGAGTQPLRGSLQLDVTRAGVPDHASAVVLNVTAVNAQGPGYLATHPRGSARPNASNVNYTAGSTIANAVIARVGTGGDVCVFNLSPTDVIVDVAGYLTGPAPATVGDPCPGTSPGDPNAAAAVVRRPGLHQAVGVDRVAILVCDLGQGAPALDPGQVAAWANQTVAPWFSEASRGAYAVEFASIGRIFAASTTACMNEAAKRAGPPFTNSIAVPEIAYGGGEAGPGMIWPDSSTGVLDGTPPSQTLRGGYVGGEAAFVNPSVFVHEMGHTLHWPHSYIPNPGDPYDEYDNPVDVMSGEPEAPFESENYCVVPGTGGLKTPCFPQHTLAFNRVAAGWVAGTQVAVHRSGRANYVLDKPAGNGMQVVVLPDPGDPNRMMTLEARPATGPDRFLEVAGVAVHLIDQTGSGYNERISLNRRQQQAAGEPFGYGHVVTPGQSVTIHGVTISVYQNGGGEGYALMVDGSYRSPGLLADKPPVLVPQSTEPESVGTGSTGPWFMRLE